MALLEADTDGVFFAVPAGWSAGQEQALVAEIAATLPAGLRLEYEGRYQAMLSHEVKNYALLSYDGALLLRGGALRSSRAEPFGTQFLQAAIGHTLRGDVSGVRQVYQATLAALRARQVPLAAVATRARLAKTPAEYQRSRGQAREAPYEALLAAGRSAWEVGEHVRFYRAQGGQFVWLPDEADTPPEVSEEATASGDAGRPAPAEAVEAPRDYDVAHYVRVLQTSYVSRLRKAFGPDDFSQLFRADGQLGLFDQPLAQIEPLWVRPPAS